MIYRIFKIWVLLAFIATAACGLVYLAVQQSLRQGANDPQIQMAEDAAAALQTGIPAQGVIPQGTVSFAGSLAPYLVVFDANGNPVAGNGFLDGALPHLPAGVFAYAFTHDEDRFTWQPESDVRQAVVVTRVNDTNGGFVMAGRSLREVEVRENHTFLEAAAVWLAALVGTFILLWLFAIFERRKDIRGISAPEA